MRLSATDIDALDRNQTMIEKFRRMAQVKISVLSDEEIVQIMRETFPTLSMQAFIRTALRQGCGN